MLVEIDRWHTYELLSEPSDYSRSTPPAFGTERAFRADESVPAAGLRKTTPSPGR